MKIKFFLLFIFFFLFTTFFSVAGERVYENLSMIKKGMTRTEVRRKLGNPVQMRGRIWKYKNFFLIFNAGLLDCAVRGECFGKWNNCHSFRQRSKDCLLVN